MNRVRVEHWRPQGGGATGAMAPPLAREGGAILSFGPTFDMKGKRQKRYLDIVVHPECRIFTFVKAKFQNFSRIPKISWGLNSLRADIGPWRRWWSIESFSAYFSCDIGTVKFGKSNF